MTWLKVESIVRSHKLSTEASEMFLRACEDMDFSPMGWAEVEIQGNTYNNIFLGLIEQEGSPATGGPASPKLVGFYRFSFQRALQHADTQGLYIGPSHRGKKLSWAFAAYCYARLVRQYHVRMICGGARQGSKGKKILEAMLRPGTAPAIHHHIQDFYPDRKSHTRYYLSLRDEEMRELMLRKWDKVAEGLKKP